MSTYFQSLLVLLNFGLKFLYTLLVDSYNIFLYITDSLIRYLCFFVGITFNYAYVRLYMQTNSFEYIVKKFGFRFPLGGVNV